MEDHIAYIVCYNVPNDCHNQDLAYAKVWLKNVGWIENKPNFYEQFPHFWAAKCIVC